MDAEKRMRQQKLKTAVSEQIIQHKAKELDMTVSEYGKVYDSEKHEELLNNIMREMLSWHQQEIAKEINKALLLQFEMDLANLPKYDIIHDLPEEYIAARKLSLEVSIETLKEHKEE